MSVCKKLNSVGKTKDEVGLAAEKLDFNWAKFLNSFNFSLSPMCVCLARSKWFESTFFVRNCYICQTLVLVCVFMRAGARSPCMNLTMYLVEQRYRFPITCICTPYYHLGTTPTIAGRSLSLTRNFCVVFELKSNEEIIDEVFGCIGETSMFSFFSSFHSSPFCVLPIFSNVQNQ